jgi:hypothetical protein
MSSASFSSAGHKHPRDGAAALSNRRVQPRHFHCGRNPVPGDDMLADLKDDACAPLITSAARLYRHALESVFAFCSLQELGSLLGVSKEWAAAVNSMRSLGAWLPYPPDDSHLLHFCLSPLSRHVSVADVWAVPLSQWSLYLCSTRMSNLQELTCRFEGSWAPVVFPARLRTLSLGFLISASSGQSFSDKQLRELDAAIAAVAALPLLESLHVTAIKAIRCCLTPLSSSPSLRALELKMPSSVFDSDAVDALRRMPHLRSLTCSSSPAILTRMLQVPHTMKLDTLILYGPFTADYGDAIVSLPSLTKIDLSLASTHTDFLRQLPNLRILRFTSHLCTVLPDADRIMSSLHSLVGLTELSIHGGGYCALAFTSAHLTTYLPHLPQLTSLHLSGATAVDSLRFLASGPITRSLKELELENFDPRLPLRELLHVHALSSLTKLIVSCMFDRPLDDHALPLYTPPSLLLPALREFEYEFEPSDYEEEGEED